MAVDTPAEKVYIFSLIYSMSYSEFGGHRPIFIIFFFGPDRDNTHTPPEHSERVSSWLSGIPLPG